jgi:hypothetical protein
MHHCLRLTNTGSPGVGTRNATVVAKFADSEVCLYLSTCACRLSTTSLGAPLAMARSRASFAVFKFCQNNTRTLTESLERTWESGLRVSDSDL